MYLVLLALHVIQFAIIYKPMTNIECMATFKKKFLIYGSLFILSDIVVVAILTPMLMEEQGCASLLRMHVFVDIIIAILKVPNVYLERILHDRKIVQIANYVIKTLHLRDIPAKPEEEEVKAEEHVTL